MSRGDGFFGEKLGPIRTRGLRPSFPYILDGKFPAPNINHPAPGSFVKNTDLDNKYYRPKPVL